MNQSLEEIKSNGVKTVISDVRQEDVEAHPGVDRTQDLAHTLSLVLIRNRVLQKLSRQRTLEKLQLGQVQFMLGVNSPVV